MKIPWRTRSIWLPIYLQIWEQLSCIKFSNDFVKERFDTSSLEARQEAWNKQKNVINSIWTFMCSMRQDMKIVARSMVTDSFLNTRTESTEIHGSFFSIAAMSALSVFHDRWCNHEEEIDAQLILNHSTKLWVERSSLVWSKQRIWENFRLFHSNPRWKRNRWEWKVASRNNTLTSAIKRRWQQL